MQTTGAAVGAFVALLHFKAGMFRTLAASVGVGALWYLLASGCWN